MNEESEKKNTEEEESAQNPRMGGGGGGGDDDDVSLAAAELVRRLAFTASRETTTTTRMDDDDDENAQQKNKDEVRESARHLARGNRRARDAEKSRRRRRKTSSSICSHLVGRLHRVFHGQLPTVHDFFSKTGTDGERVCKPSRDVSQVQRGASVENRRLDGGVGVFPRVELLDGQTGRKLRVDDEAWDIRGANETKVREVFWRGRV